MPSKKSSSDSKVRPSKVAGNLPESPQVEDIPTHPPEDVPVVEAPTPVPEVVPVPPAPTVPPAPGASIDKEKLLTFIEDIIDTLSFKRIGLIALMTAFGLLLFSLYENRNAIVGKITAPTVAQKIDTPVASNWILSEASKQSLIGLAKTTSVGMLIVSDVDLKKNRRTVHYYYIDDQSIKLEPAAQQALALPLPVFDYDAKNTEQMVAILSNDFRCDPYKDTVYFRHAPELADKFPTICRLAIPPFVGQFVGFLTVGITGEVSKIELETIRLEVSRIAVEIYLNDVIKKPVASK